MLLIGAEGAHSRVREYLFGKEKAALQPTKVVSMIATPRLPADQALRVRELHPRYCPFFHPNGHFAWVGSEYSNPSHRNEGGSYRGTTTQN